MEQVFQEQHDQTLRNIEVVGLGQYESTGEWRGIATSEGAGYNSSGNTVTLNTVDSTGTTPLAHRWVVGSYIFSTSISLTGFSNGLYAVASVPSTTSLTISAACTANATGGSGYITGPLNGIEKGIYYNDLPSTTLGNIIVDKVYAHDFSQGAITFSGMTNVTLSNSVLARTSSCFPTNLTCGNTGQISVHGFALQPIQLVNLTVANNIMQDVEGTGFIDNTGHVDESNWNIYGNIFYNTPNNPYQLQEGVNGVLVKVSGGGNMTNLNFFNNTIWNVNIAGTDRE